MHDAKNNSSGLPLSFSLHNSEAKGFPCKLRFSICEFLFQTV